MCFCTFYTAAVWTDHLLWSFNGKYDVISMITGKIAILPVTGKMSTLIYI